MKGYEEGVLDGIKGLKDPDCHNPDYNQGYREGEARYKLLLSSTEDHTDIPPVGRVICGADDRPVPLPLPVNVHGHRPAAKRKNPQFLDEGEFDTREINLIEEPITPMFAGAH